MLGGGGGGGLVREKGTRRICLPRGKRGVGDMLYIVVGIGKGKKKNFNILRPYHTHMSGISELKLKMTTGGKVKV